MKFHPELNAIERVWQVIKRFVRSYNEGNLAAVRKLYAEAIQEENLPKSLIRRFIRLVNVYLIAYESGLSLVQAEEFRKDRRSHRCYNPAMDEILAGKIDELYSPALQTNQAIILGLQGLHSMEEDDEMEVEEVSVIQGSSNSTIDEENIQESLLDSINEVIIFE